MSPSDPVDLLLISCPFSGCGTRVSLGGGSAQLTNSWIARHKDEVKVWISVHLSKLNQGWNFPFASRNEKEVGPIRFCRYLRGFFVVDIPFWDFFPQLTTCTS
jgi:hypothetical protein